MNRIDLQNLALMRIEEAKYLLDGEYFVGAYYLCGYAVECGLKACIAKQVQAGDFPTKDNIKSHTHEFSKLISIAKLESELAEEFANSPKFKANWEYAKKWLPEQRYELSMNYQTAKDLYEAITDPTHGVLEWIKKFW